MGGVAIQYERGPWFRFERGALCASNLFGSGWRTMSSQLLAVLVTCGWSRSGVDIVESYSQRLSLTELSLVNQC